MGILHVVAALPAAGGGLAEAVARLAGEAARLGHDVTIATVAGRDEPLAAAALEAEAAGVRIVRHEPAALRPIFFLWAMLHKLGLLAAAADRVHVHSDWTFPVWRGCYAPRTAGTPLVTSPHSCLDPVRLAHSAWKKRIAGPIERRCLRQADVIHAKSLAERDWIQRYIGGIPRIEVIPIGADLPAARAALKRQARKLGIGNVRFAGPVYGAEKARELADADLFVMPSRSENFGIAAAKAVAAGLPVITTKGTPWQEIDGTCGWWVDTAAEPLAAAIGTATQLSDAERSAMGARGERWLSSIGDCTGLGSDRPNGMRSRARRRRCSAGPLRGDPRPGRAPIRGRTPSC